MSVPSTEPVAVAEIDLGALRRNVGRLRARLAPGVRTLVAVKADAYGHGLVPVARALLRAGVDALGVATPDEALTLRRAGIEARIMLFVPAYGPVLGRLVEAGVELTVADDRQVHEAVSVARGRTRPRLHLKVDTGMGRLGRRPEEAAQVARTLRAAPDAELASVWTHFARADEPEQDTTDAQLRAFDAFLDGLAMEGVRPGLRHAANSAGLLAYPASHYDMVRPGLAVYGYAPVAWRPGAEGPLEPVMRLRAPVVFVKRLRAGEAVSYGHDWTAANDTTVATVRMGYGDGYPRALSNLGEMALPNGRRARVVGTVCMDQLLLDVGDAPVEVGTWVDVWGGLGPGADELAERAGSISYELLTRVTNRPERRYLEPPDETPA